MGNLYEIAVILHADLEIDPAKGTAKVEKIFKDNGGKVIGTDNWGKRKLAYPIRKQEHGLYVFYQVELPAENVRKVESILNITDEVIRFLITRPDLKAIQKAEAAKAEKQKKAKARQEASAESEDQPEDKPKAKDEKKEVTKEEGA